MHKMKDFLTENKTPFVPTNKTNRETKKQTISQHQIREACKYKNKGDWTSSINDRHHSSESHDLLHFNLIGLHSGSISQWTTRKTPVGGVISSHMTRSITTRVGAVR